MAQLLSCLRLWLHADSMHRLKLIGASSIILLVAGCTTPSRQELLDPMVGQDVEVAIEAFGKPDEIVDLEEGRHVYIWRRVYNYDTGRRADSWPERRLGGWIEDEDEQTDSRVCSTRLTIGFDLLIEEWEYGCETVFGSRMIDRSTSNTQDSSPGSERD